MGTALSPPVAQVPVPGCSPAVVSCNEQLPLVQLGFSHLLAENPSPEEWPLLARGDSSQGQGESISVRGYSASRWARKVCLGAGVPHLCHVIRTGHAG